MSAVCSECVDYLAVLIIIIIIIIFIEYSYSLCTALSC